MVWNTGIITNKRTSGGTINCLFRTAFSAEWSGAFVDCGTSIIDRGGPVGYELSRINSVRGVLKLMLITSALGLKLTYSCVLGLDE